MSIKRNIANRAGTLAAAVAVVLGVLIPAVVPLVSAATAQVTSRSIEMSDSTPSKTNVTYSVTFTPATSGADSAIIDFCNNSSIIGGLCTAPAGMNANASLALSSGPTGWVVDTTGLASNTRVLLKDGTPGTNNLGTSAVTFVLTGVQNTSALGSFWARTYTYGDATFGATSTIYVDPTSIGNNLDYGGFALSTTELINITATVMETLTFCTSKVAPGNSCTATSTPNLILGHGSPAVIDSTQPDPDTAYFQISTNALTGAVVRMKSHNACANGGLSRDGGTTCPIPGIGTLAAFTPAAAQFGMNVQAVVGGVGSVVANANYDGTTTTNFGMGNQTIGGTNDPTSTYGADIANTAGTATANVNSLLTFAAQASVTTPAGVYSANESLIATGTF